MQIALLTKVLALLIQDLQMAYERAPHNFNQRAYLRILGSLLFELNAPDPTLDPIQPQVLGLRRHLPRAAASKLPGFAFAWLGLISHHVHAKDALAKGQRGWPHMQRLLVGLFTFLQPSLSRPSCAAHAHALPRRAARAARAAARLPRVPLRLPLRALRRHHRGASRCATSCLAFPRNMRLPDPFTPNLKVDLLPEIAQPPRILSPVTAPLVAANLLNGVDDFLNGRAPLSALDLRFRLVTNDGTPRSALINALVLHAGQSGIAALQNSQAQAQALAHSPPMELYQRGLRSRPRNTCCSTRSQPAALPNNHTHYFSCCLPLRRVVRGRAGADTRVLVERLIAPAAPVGLLITFIELIKNPRYAFWNKTFTLRAEIERLFERRALGAGRRPRRVAHAWQRRRCLRGPRQRAVEGCGRRLPRPAQRGDRGGGQGRRASTARNAGREMGWEHGQEACAAWQGVIACRQGGQAGLTGRAPRAAAAATRAAGMEESHARPGLSSEGGHRRTRTRTHTHMHDACGQRFDACVRGCRRVLRLLATTRRGCRRPTDRARPNSAKPSERHG